VAGPRDAGARRGPGADARRSAWIGASVAIALLLALKDLRLTVLLPIFIALLFVVAPNTVTNA
jgi:hypothetical protein